MKKTSKPHILLTLGAFLPGYKSGGPIPSIANMVTRLGDEFEFSILTSDRDLGSVSPYPDVPTDRWIDSYGARVRYCSPPMLSGKAIASTIRDTPHDLLYLNSFFATRFSIFPLVARRLGKLINAPTLLAPRGEFSAGALALKAGKKSTYLRLGSSTGLFRGLHWHASTEHEAADIRAVMGVDDAQIAIASDLSATLPDMPPLHKPRAPGTPLRVLFLSRVSPMKNLDYALHVLKDVDLPVNFTIVGPEEDATYSERCRELVNALPKNIQVRWVGPIQPDAIPQTMANNDLFFLPTLGENFGHVIAEALGAGTPVLLSDTTPWRGLAELGIGHDLPLAQPQRFRDALYDAWHQSATEAVRTRARAAFYAREKQRNSADIEANRALFRTVLDTASSWDELTVGTTT